MIIFITGMGAGVFLIGAIVSCQRHDFTAAGIRATIAVAYVLAAAFISAVTP